LATARGVGQRCRSMCISIASSDADASFGGSRAASPITPCSRDESKVSLDIDSLPGSERPPAPRREVAGDAGWRTGVQTQIRRIGNIPAHRPPYDRQGNAFSAEPEGNNRVAVSLHQWGRQSRPATRVASPYIPSVLSPCVHGQICKKQAISNQARERMSARSDPAACRRLRASFVTLQRRQRQPLVVRIGDKGCRCA